MNAFQHVRGFARSMVVAWVAMAAVPALGQTTTFGGGVNPAGGTVCPGGASTPVDSFTLSATTSDSVRNVRVRLSPVGAYQLISKVEIRSDNLSVLYGSMVPQDDGPNVALTTPIPVTTTQTQYKVVLIPRSHVEMPPPSAGAATSISAIVVSLVSSLPKTGSDPTSGPLTIDNLPPADVAVAGVTTTAVSANINWTASAQVLVLRKQNAVVADAPVDGVTYAAGNTIGTSTVRTVATATAFNDTGLTSGQTYYYRLFTRDACGNWSQGLSLGPVMPGAVAEGDAALNSRKPVVGIVNPSSGVVTSPFKVQVRVFSPLALNNTTVQPITAVTGQANNGTTNFPISLARNSNYGTATDSGIWETPVAGQTLAPGNYTLRVQATNASGSVWSGPVSVSVTVRKGDGNLLVRDNSEQMCSDCHAIKTHSAEATGPKYGSWSAGCRTCHQPHGTPNASLIAKQITPPAVNGALPSTEVRFSTRVGYSEAGSVANAAAASYANGDDGLTTTPASGVCQVCHMRTDFYLRDGTLTTTGTPHYTANCGSCHKHTDGFKGGGCDGCHGQADRTTFSKVAPPKDTCGNTTSTGGTGKNRVGAHAKHLTGGTFGGAVACASCHIEAPSRPDHPATPTCNDADRATMTWGGIATGGGWTAAVVPDYDFVGQTCSSTYCHGAFTNGTNASPSWTGGPMVCGSCHAAPPATTDHDGVTTCAGCHANGYSLSTVDPVDHMNGTLEATGCTGCHGGTKAVVATGAIQAQVDAMPPTDAEAAKNTATTFVGVGAHVEHANSNTSLALPLACDKCHSWASFPTGTAHKDGATPMLASLNWNLTNKTCSVAACHGPSTPVWTTVDGSFKQCNDCHGAPPAITTNHPQNTTCADCHPGYSTATSTVVRTTHVDGAVNANTVTGCARCHGKLGTNAVAATSLDAAPGVNTNEDSKGNLAAATNVAGVGAHKAHLQPRYFNGAIACIQCHPSPSYADATHANGAAAVPFPTGSLARTGAVSPTYATNTCSATYCHGNFTGGTSANPTWSVAGLLGTSMQCYSCHGTGTSPLPTLAADHPQNTTCGSCHTNYTSSSVAGALATHIDGLKTVNTSTGCARCHGKLGTNAVTYGADAAPGVTTAHYDSKGNNATTAAGVGAHASHVVADAVSDAIACNECHSTTISGTTHADGAFDLPFGTIAKTGPVTPAYASTACSSTYCHGNFVGGLNASINWTTGTTACNSCHLLPPIPKAAGATPVSYHPNNADCVGCHGTGYSTTTVAAATHVKGTVTLVAARTGCVACHGTPGLTPYDTTNADPNVAAGPSSGAHAAHVNPATASKVKGPLHCTECHGTDKTDRTHANNDALPVWTASVLATANSTTASYTSPNCSNYCHGAKLAAGQAVTPSWTGTLTGCNTCHGNGTSVAPPSHDAAINLATECSGCHTETVTAAGAIIFAADGTTKHINGLVEGGESSGGAATQCSSCHATIVSGMNTGTAHRHQMLAAGSQPGAPVGSGYPTTTTAQRCLQCHVDHNIFRTDLNANGVRAENLRTAYNVQPTATTGYQATDHTGTTGICVSCHATAQTKATGLPDAGATTPVINGTTFGASAHTFAATSTFSKDASVFSANCSKCHNQAPTTTYQGSRKFALHDALQASLLDPLASTASSPLEEHECYRCHSKTTDTLPGDGPAKTTALRDYYNATAMTASAEDVLTQMNKGAPGAPAQAVTQVTSGTLYFMPNSEFAATEPMPNAHATGDTLNATSTWIGRAMAPVPSAVAYETKSQSTNVSGTANWRMVTFTSPPAAQAISIPAGSWTINMYDREANTAQNARIRYMIYKWNAADSIGTTIVARGNFTTEMPTTAAPGGLQTQTFTGAAVSLAVGDKLVVDLEMQTTATVTTAYIGSYYWGSGAASNVVMPASPTFSYSTTLPATPATGRHDVGAYTGAHKTVETRGGIAAAKHVECADCHNPHSAGRGGGTAGGTATAAGTTTTLTDSSKAWTANQWKGYYVTLVSPTAGARAGQSALITANTATALTFDAITTAPVSGDTYQIADRTVGGVATAGAAGSLTDASKAWTGTNVWAGWYAYIQSGTGAGQVKPIASNTATVLTLVTGNTFSPIPDTTSVYRIVKSAAEPLTGAAGVDVTTWPVMATNWAAGQLLGATYNPSTTTANLITANAQWQVCFKCHSGANASIESTTWSPNGSFTDIAREFNPNNQSYHPVVRALTASTDTGAGSSRLGAATRVINGWKRSDLMSCTDCHNTDAAAPAAQGPHGSAIKYMLAGANRAWPYTTAGATSGTVWSLNATETNIGTANGMFCRNCHPAMGASNALHTAYLGRSNHNVAFQCVKCHIRIPHGGKVSRLLVTTNAPARYLVSGNTPVLDAITKSTAADGTMTGSNIDDYSGCNQHTNAQTESW